MKISKDIVLHIMKLSRLKISPSELQKYQKELEKILEYFSVIEKVDIKNIEPIAQITNLKNVWRDDVISEFSDQQKLINAAPKKSRGFFKTKRILE